MNNIFDCGCYRIGKRKPVICKSRNEVVSLTLKENKEKSEKRLAKKKYNLEELRDLESKLVLITGRNAPNRKMVEFFLDVSISTLQENYTACSYLSAVLSTLPTAYHGYSRLDSNLAMYKLWLS